MNESIIISKEVKQHFSARATLAALGVKIREKKLFEPIGEKVKIAQKTVKYTPIEKLMDAEIAILSGAHGMVEINKRVRADRGLQVAFGRDGCAEQSVVQDTLDACSKENVSQMQAALDQIYRQHSQGYGHDYQKGWQLLDVDMTGRPCGRKAVFASKGYFAKQRNRRGRQEGYRIAVRCRKKNGHWGVGVLISTLSSQEVLKLTGEPIAKASNPRAVLLAYVHFYDLRGGGVETEIKEDKQGLGTSKRNKKRFEAQSMLILLEALAHNILVWARLWLAHWCPRVAQFGMLRLVRDAFHMNGLILLDPDAQVLKIVLNRADPFAQELCAGFAALFAQQQLAFSLGEI